MENEMQVENNLKLSVTSIKSKILGPFGLSKLTPDIPAAGKNSQSESSSRHAAGLWGCAGEAVI